MKDAESFYKSLPLNYSDRELVRRRLLYRNPAAHKILKIKFSCLQILPSAMAFRSIPTEKFRNWLTFLDFQSSSLKHKLEPSF